MTLLEREQKCLRCAGRGIDRKATRGKFCDDCWGDDAKEKLAMPRKKSIDWEAAQRERDAGVPAVQLIEKLGVSSATFYTRTHAGRNGAKRAAKRTFSKGYEATRQAQIDLVLAELRSKRDKLEEVIRTIEGL